ncbi:hypothetical protein ABMA70_03190 [Halobacteriovorax sp. XZX-3]|uniref:hypothetical protein n=1 Tax=unclassified Halobacteriovorax TaxID=2639665 RepID=UPI0011AF215C|nr:hypothetical protein [Halobacteriovorax sp. DA5]
MTKLMSLFVSCQLLFGLSSYASHPKVELANKYLKARKQYLLEYTTFGVDECLKLHADKIVSKEDGSGRIVVGTPRYFQLLSSCFKNITNTCYGENCIVSRSMSKRLKNVDHVDSILNSL